MKLAKNLFIVVLMVFVSLYMISCSNSDPVGITGNSSTSTTVDNNKSINKYFGTAIKNYNTESEPIAYALQSLGSIKDVILSSNQVSLESNGASEFIDVVGATKDGSYIVLTNNVVWSSQNSDVAFADEGRILALSAGNTVVTVKYGTFTKKINVSVMRNVNIAAAINKSTLLKASLAVSTVEAKKMVDLTWTPKKNVRGWRNNPTYFKANIKYKGLPYSQTAYQKGYSGFNEALKLSDFYANYTRFNIIMPKYGNDCSGFVSFSWAISRKTTSDFIAGLKNGTYAKVGSYSAYNPTKTDLKASYKKLQAGNAVVKDGHTFIIASNVAANSKVYAYEQTPPYAQYTTWSYESMANGGYMPFAKK